MKNRRSKIGGGKTWRGRACQPHLPSPAPSSSRLSLRVHHTSSLLQPLSLLHSFAMPMIGNLHISLCRRGAGLTKSTLRFPSYSSLLPRCHARLPLVVCRTSFTTPSSSKLVVS